MSKKKKSSDEMRIDEKALYSEYEFLVLKKETLLENSKSYELRYLAEFGGLLSDILSAKLECIRLKKTISYCLRYINAGETIDASKMQMEIDNEMLKYLHEMDDFIKQYEVAKKSPPVDDLLTVRKTKQVFRRIARRLHPDVNARTVQIPRLQDLWIEVMKAYYLFDVEKLEDLEIVLNHTMKELGEDGFAINLDNLEERISKVKKRIVSIENSKAYKYGEVLSSPEARREKKMELEKEQKSYDDYRQELSTTLDKLIMGGSTITWKIIL